ncbi:MAG: chromosomal replication initiator protein DnaA [Candidatus Parcubacteria bacterium]|nr:MAG: chromosomal replication initiator protein DnaA [Candidatus Parcubacteria bacterium]
MTNEQVETIWDQILNNIKNNVGTSIFNVWFSYFQPKNFNQGILKVEVPSKFVKDWLEKKFSQIILRSVKEIIPEVKSLELIVSSQNIKSQEKQQTKTYFSKKIDILSSQKKLSLFEINPQTNLNPRYRFDNFVVGQSNELAFAACQAVANSYGKVHNPLFIYGQVGVGKTHLLQASGNEALKKFKNIKLKYLTTEEFTNEFINSLRNHNVNEFREKFRDIDVLILDDVHFLSGKNTSQEELFHTFNYLYNHSKQIIFSSDRPPKLIPDIEERLRSRFEGGLVIDIQPPDYETRIAILKLKAQEKNVFFDDEIYELIAQKITSNIRELEGALSNIIFHFNQFNQKITLEKVEELLKKFSKEYYRKINPKKIIKTVTEHYELKEDDILKKTRTKHLTKARQCIIYFLREITQLSYTSIGEILKKDHTTIIYSYEKIVKEMKKNPELSQDIEVIRTKLIES